MNVGKFSLKEKIDMQWLVDRNSITEKEAEYLKRAIEEKRNILISGGTGSGKTVLLNALMDCIPKELAAVALEEYRELYSEKENIMYQEINEMDEKSVSAYVTFLLVNENPQYLFVNDIRKYGFFELCGGIGNANKSIIVSLYAKNHYDALMKFLNKAIDTNNFMNTDAEIKKWIGNGLDIIIHTKRLENGNRKASITEVMDFKEETNSFMLQEVKL